MTRLVRGALLSGLMSMAARAAVAQIGEVHLGAVASYGTSEAFGKGAGLVVGVAAGRLTYLGLRWTSYHGNTTPYAGPGAPVDVKNRTSSYIADLGIMIPAGKADLLPGVGLGWLHFTQNVRPAAGSETVRHGDEFLATPGVAVEIHLARLALIPELQYSLSGSPDLPYPVGHAGAVATLRVVIPFEVGRVRY